MQVHTTSEDLDKLAEALDGARKNGTTVKVPRQALANLVCDARAIFTEAEKIGQLKQKGDA